MNEQLIEQLAEQAGMSKDKYGMFFAKDFESHKADGVDLAEFAHITFEVAHAAGERAQQRAIQW